MAPALPAIPWTYSGGLLRATRPRAPGRPLDDSRITEVW